MMPNTEGYETNRRNPSSSALRACLLCATIKTYDEFLTDGCDNCEKYLRMMGQPNTVMECTTQYYSGRLLLLKPNESWVGDRLRHHSHAMGLYALQIFGVLPDYIQDELLSKGVQYVPRGNEPRAEGEIALE